MRDMRTIHMSSGRGFAGVVLAQPSPDIRAAFTAALTEVEARVSVRWFDDGAQCLAYLQALELPPGDPAPRLVLMSFHLPRLGGLQVLQRLRNGRARRGLPVVMTGAPTDGGLVRPAYQAGANSCVLLPEDREQRTLSLSTVLEYWMNVVVGPVPEARAG